MLSFSFVSLLLFSVCIHFFPCHHFQFFFLRAMLNNLISLFNFLLKHTYSISIISSSRFNLYNFSSFFFYVSLIIFACAVSVNKGGNLLYMMRVVVCVKNAIGYLPLSRSIEVYSYHIEVRQF